MTTNKKWFVGIGIVIGLIVLFTLPFIWHAIFPAANYGYGMMGGYGRAPMMSNGYGPDMMGYGFGFGFGLMWLIPLALLTLLGLSIAALIKYLRTP